MSVPTKRLLASRLKRIHATPTKVTHTAIIFHHVGVRAALRLLEGPRPHRFKTATDLRRFLLQRGIGDQVSIRQFGPPHQPVFAVRYAAAPAADRRALRSQYRQQKIAQLAQALRHATNVAVEE